MTAPRLAGGKRAELDRRLHRAEEELQIESLRYFAMGTVLGLAAGVSPGPLLVLIVSETVRSGKRAGMQIAMVPLVSDLPIILLSFLILDQVGSYRGALSWLSLAGAGYLMLLAVESMSAKAPAGSGDAAGSKTMLKGVLANYLSPHPYLFWVVVGGPILVQGLGTSRLNGIAFLLSFYLFIVGLKAALAILVASGTRFLTGRAYGLILKGSGVLLIVIAMWLVYDAVHFLYGQL